MIHWSMLMTALMGICILILAHVMYIGILLGISYHLWLRSILHFSPVIAAFVVAYFSPRRKILMGMSMAIYGTIIAALSAYFYERMGFYVDRIGGPVATLLILFAYNAALSSVGCITGYLISKWKTNRRTQN